MKWVLEHLQFIIAAAAAIAYYLNRRRGEAQEQPGEETPRKVVNAETAEQAERTRQIQAEIRRKIAERRGKMADVPSPGRTVRERIPPLVRPAQTPPIDPFGGPMRRIIRELEQAAEKRLEPVPDPEEAARAAALERQQRLAAEMRALDAERLAEQRRAQEITRAAQPISPPSASKALGSIRADLRSPRELRRAIVLREILGAPVALR